MKALVDRNELNNALEIAAGATSVRAALPVLSSIRIEASDSGLTLVGCDGEMWGSATVAARIESPGAVCVQQRLLTEIVGALGPGEASLELEGTSVYLRHGQAEWKMLALPAEEFPDVPQFEPSSSLQMPYGVLMRGINGVQFAVSDDATRQALTGVLFSYDGQTLTLVATDTHRMSVYKIHQSGLGSEINATVPKKALNIIKHLPIEDDETITVSFDDTRLSVDVGSARMVSQLLSGPYPNWERVVPAEHTRSWMLDRMEFHDNVKRAMILARDNANRVKFSGNGEFVTVSAQSQDRGEAKEKIACVAKNGEVEIAFNGRYIMDALNAMEGEGVTAEMTEASRPAILRPSDNGDDHFCVVMPMAIG